MQNLKFPAGLPGEPLRTPANRIRPQRRAARGPLPWWRMRLGRLGPRHKLFLCSQIEACIDAGFPLTEAFRLAGEWSSHWRQRRICRAVAKDLAAGRRLAQALAPHEEHLSPFLVRMLEAAERSGSYIAILQTLQRHFAWLMELKGEILKAVVYPLAVLLLGKLVLAVRDFVILDIVRPEWNTTGRTALLLLGMLLWQYYRSTLIAIMLAWGLAKAVRESRLIKKPVDRLALRLPFVGAMIRCYSIANFCRMYTAQLESGLHPLLSYRTAAASMGNTGLEHRLLEWEKFIRDGEPVSEALLHSAVMPPDVLTYVVVGELSGSTDALLPRVAEFMTSEIHHEMRAAVRVLTPIAIILIAMAFFWLPWVWDLTIGFLFFLIFLI